MSDAGGNGPGCSAARGVWVHSSGGSRRAAVVVAPPFARRLNPSLVPRARVFGNPNYKNASVSPNGKWIAYTAPLDGVMNIWLSAFDAPDRESRSHTSRSS